MKKSNWIAPALIIVGILLIFLSTWSPKDKLDLGFTKKKLATLIEKSGSIKVQNTDLNTTIEVSREQKLEAREMLRSDSNSEALIEFNTGAQFRLTELSEVLLDILDDGTPLVVVRTGDILVEKFGQPPSFWVRKEGQLYNAVDFALVDKKNNTRLNNNQANLQNKEQITQLEIENTLNSRKNDFFKCYGQLIQKVPRASGQVLISFTIENQGQTSKVEISKSDIDDFNFISCLKEVVARTRFRTFTGNPVTTVFPLKFE